MEAEAELFSLLQHQHPLSASQALQKYCNRLQSPRERESRF